MFKKIKKTSYHPARPLLIWDGACKFCQYWILRLQPCFSEELDIEPYQKIDISITGLTQNDYAEAVRLIDRDGSVYNGPEVFYRALESDVGDLLLRLYQKSKAFRWLNDVAYELIAQNRAAFFRITKSLWGKNPRRPKFYWALYVSLILIGLMTIVLI